MKEIKLNAAAIKRVAIQASADDLRVRANRVLNAARRGAPVDTGRLRSSLTIQFVKGPGGMPIARIGSNLPYAIWQEQGTGIYGPRGTPIVPKHAKFLVFTPRVAKGPVFARSVRGSKARHFLLHALDAAK